MIADNFSPHKHPQVTGWAAANGVELVFLPACASWLNWIESEFAALRYFALNGTDHRTHAEQGEAIAGYIRWRNAPRPAQTRLRPRLSDPDLDRLQDQRCLTRHQLRTPRRTASKRDQGVDCSYQRYGAVCQASAWISNSGCLRLFSDWSGRRSCH